MDNVQNNSSGKFSTVWLIVATNAVLFESDFHLKAM